MFSIPDFAAAKARRKPIVMLTCYDAWTAAALSESGIDAILVGDSAAMVVHGQSSTLGANTAMMASHVRAVRTRMPETCIVADMPFLSTRRGLGAAVDAAGLLMQAGANAVKVEGRPGHEELIPHLIASGIPVMAHLGLQPQSVNLSGGFRVQGRSESAAAELKSDAILLQDLGCFAIVLECIPAELAAAISASLTISAIGIGAGSATDGQILVLQDLLGFTPGGDHPKVPRFVRRYLNGQALVRQAANDFVADVRTRDFPAPQESYTGTTADLPEKKPLPRLIHDPLEWQAYCRGLSRRGSLGFVPTMGALHQGHIALARQAAQENDFALVSIFVNPAQFNDQSDLAAYPRTLEADCALLATVGVTAVFAPDADSVYPDDYHYRVNENQLSGKWCGAFRPGHFDGVLSVVLKLLLLTGAQQAYFGEKDWQQLQLIRGMARAFFLETAIIGCPIVREASGLALSSRNERLSPTGRTQAAAFFRILREAPDCASARTALEAEGFQVEYVEDDRAAQRRLAAIWLEGVRLIDNVALDGAPVPTPALAGAQAVGAAL